MMSASLIASTAWMVARPGCPGPTPTSLTLLPGPTTKRLELSRNHVAGQGGQRFHCRTRANYLELAPRIGRQRPCRFDSSRRASTRAHERHHLAGFRRAQLVSGTQHRGQTAGHRSLLHGEHDGEIRETPGDVVADRLAD